MPTNKQASFRYRILDERLRRNRKWTFEQLQEEVSNALREAFGVSSGVSRRTIFSDFNLMRRDPPEGYGADIVCENGLYFYRDRSFTIHNQALSEQDRETIRSAVMLLSQFNGLPVVDPLRDIMDRLEGWARYPNTRVIQFETNERSAGADRIAVLYDAIIGKRALEVTYFPFIADEAASFVFHPYLIKEYRNRWFVYGLNGREGVVHNLALDRIREISESTMPYRVNTFFDPETWFLDIVGVTRPADAFPRDIIFRASPLQSRYLITKPIHHSQKLLEETPQGTVFSIHVIPNYELYSELLRHGRALEVLSPEDVMEELRRM